MSLSSLKTLLATDTQLSASSIRQPLTVRMVFRGFRFGRTVSRVQVVGTLRILSLHLVRPILFLSTTLFCGTQVSKQTKKLLANKSAS
jgi:hypothetical protein